MLGYFDIGRIIAVIAGVLTFIGGWIYCIAHYGFLLGVGLGWLPAAITAAVVAYFLLLAWGVIALGIAGVVIYAVFISTRPAPPPTIDVPSAAEVAEDASKSSSWGSDPVAAPAPPQTTAQLLSPPPTSAPTPQELEDYQAAIAGGEAPPAANHESAAPTP